MIFYWTLIIIVLVLGLCTAFWVLKEFDKGKIAAVLIIIATIAICFAMGWWLYNSESGKRAIKDTKSNLSGGIERTVTVYDIDGEIIQQYSGKFDVSYDSERIKFDDEKGKRHIIYYTTGTIIIDEN